MMNHINILAAQLATALAMFFIMEGLNYIHIGLGLHPMLAGALACVLFALPHFLED